MNQPASPTMAKIVEHMGHSEIATNIDEGMAAIKGFLMGLTIAYTNPAFTGTLLDTLRSELPDLAVYPVDEFIRLMELREIWTQLDKPLMDRAPIDLDAAIEAKMEYNRTRPHRHGGNAL